MPKTKDELPKQFNIYCDESRVENVESQYMVIGALFVPRQKVDFLGDLIKNLKLKRHFYQEIKWNKVGGKYIDFYKELVEVFFKEDSLFFRAIIVNKSKILYDIYHDNDKELAFFKFYYLLLRDKLQSNSEYYILLDKKPTRDKNRARALKSFLDSHLLYKREQSQIKHLQAYESNENILIQITDFLTGLLGYANNENKESDKLKLVKYFQQKSKISLIKTTSIQSQKINILKWTPKI